MSVGREMLISIVEAVEGDVDLQRRLRAIAAILGIGTTHPAPVTVEREFDSLSEFARRLGVSRRHVANLRKRNMLITVGSGRALRVDVARSLERLRRDPDRARAVIDLDQARKQARLAAGKVTQR